ncbi:MAG: signal peptidase I [Nitrososphaerota archaeon]
MTRAVARTLVLILVIASAVLLTTQSLPGLMLLHVVSGSMEPNVPIGSIVLLARGDKPSVGDVAAYLLEVQGRRYVILHRVTGVTEDGRYVFSADAGDPYGTDLVEPERVLGRMLIAIPYLGYVVPYAPVLVGLALLLSLVPRRTRPPVQGPVDPGFLRYLPAVLVPLTLLLPVKGLPMMLGPAYAVLTLAIYAITLRFEREIRHADLVYALLSISVLVSIDYAKLAALLWGL